MIEELHVAYCPACLRPSRRRERRSRMRAGTPTASLPAGTSRVTTEPAPV